MRTQQSANTVKSETKVSVPTLTMAATLLLGRVAQSQRCRWIAASTRSDCLFPLWKCRGPTRRQSLAALTERLQRPCSPLDGALSAPRLARPFKVWTTACFVAERFAGTSTRCWLEVARNATFTSLDPPENGVEDYLQSGGTLQNAARSLSAVRSVAQWPLGLGAIAMPLERVQQSHAKRSGALGRRS